MSQPSEYDQQIGQALRALRLRYMLKQADVAERMGVQKAAIARWENGSRALNAATLLEIADLFGIPAYELLPPAHQPLPPEPALPPLDEPIAKIASLLSQRPDLIAPVLDVLLAQVAPYADNI